MSPTSKSPSGGAVYRQIEESLRARIEQGDWPVGSMLPGRRELAREYGVSLVTMERAVALLHAAGIVRTDNRRGTFVVAIEGAPAATAPGIAVTQPTTPVIGIVAPLYFERYDHLELNNHLVLALLNAMETVCADDNLQVRFYNQLPVNNQPRMSIGQTLQQAIDDGVDAAVVIALGADPNEIETSVSATAPRDMPLVCVTSSELRRPIPHVFYDNYAAGYQAAQHLLDAGVREIMVMAPFTAQWVQERLDGVRAAVDHAGLPGSACVAMVDDKHDWVNEEDPEVIGYESAIQAFAQNRVPTGVVCINDGTAFGFIRAAAEYGRVMGVDLGLVSFDNHPRSIPMGLTTLRAPVETMGQEAVRLLKNEMQGSGADYQVRLRWRLIPRASSRMTGA